MSALFDHHVHSDRSDGTVSLEGRAKSVAIRPHGVSDHYPWRDKLRNEDDIRRYVEDATKVGLRVGIEYDLGVAQYEHALRTLKYAQLLVELAETEYQEAIEKNKAAPNTYSEFELRKLKIKVELAKVKMSEVE